MDSPCTQLSVRRLVEFSLRAGDLTPANAAAMYAGMLGHKARQQQSGAEGAENERAVRWTGTRAGIALELYGRADIFYPTARSPGAGVVLRLYAVRGIGAFANRPARQLYHPAG